MHPSEFDFSRVAKPRATWPPVVVFVRQDVADRIDTVRSLLKTLACAWGLWCGVAVPAFFVWAWLGFPGLDALRAAGLNGTAPRGGAAFKELISQLTNNAEWIILTAIGLFLTATAGALIFGVRSAPDWLFRAATGFLLLMVGVPAVLA